MENTLEQKLDDLPYVRPLLKVWEDDLSGIFKKALKKFMVSEKTGKDISDLLYASDLCMRPAVGLVWSEIQYIIQDVMNGDSKKV